MKNKFKNSYKTISEVVKLLKINSQYKDKCQAHTLRYWESQFKQLKPLKINNRRYYNQKNIDILYKIQYLLKNQGMTINGVKKFLNSNNFDIASHDGTNGLKLGGTLVTATAANLNNAASTGKAIAMAMVFG